MIKEAISDQYLVTPSAATAGCSTYTTPTKPGSRRLEDGCNQCTGTDDDDDTSSYSHDDTITPVNRRLQYDYGNGYVGTELTFTITAQVPAGENPLVVMGNVESDIDAYFADQDAASETWVTRALALGADIEEGTHIVFEKPMVEEDSVHISRPGDFIDHHYSSNSNVRFGAWIGASVAGLAFVMSAKYGVKAYMLKRDADEVEEEKAAEWANVEETAGDITLNPLAAASS
jgi:hypothetical protein